MTTGKLSLYLTGMKISQADSEVSTCQVANLNERRLQRLAQAISLTKTKLDVVGIQLDWLGRKLLSTELEKAKLRRTLAECTWEFNLLRHRLKQEREAGQKGHSASTTVRTSSLGD